MEHHRQSQRQRNLLRWRKPTGDRRRQSNPLPSLLRPKVSERASRSLARCGLRPALVGTLGLAPSLVRTALRALSARRLSAACRPIGLRLYPSAQKNRWGERWVVELAVTDRDDWPKASPKGAKRCRQARA